MNIARWTQTNIHGWFFVSKVKEKVDRPSTLSLSLPLKTFFSHIVIPSSLVLIEIFSHPVFSDCFFTLDFLTLVLRCFLFLFRQNSQMKILLKRMKISLRIYIHSKDRDRLKNEYLTPYMCNTLTHLLPIFLSFVCFLAAEKMKKILLRRSLSLPLGQKTLRECCVSLKMRESQSPVILSLSSSWFPVNFFT